MNTQTYSLQTKDDRKKIPVRLLIPRKYEKLFDKTLSNFGGSKAKLLEYMVNCFQDGQNLEYACLTKLTTQYQGKGLYLAKHVFRVDPLIWHRFKCLARFYGISMCRLFVLLLLKVQNKLKSVATDTEKVFPVLAKLFERVESPYKTAMRWYKANTTAFLSYKNPAHDLPSYRDVTRLCTWSACKVRMRRGSP